MISWRNVISPRSEVAQGKFQDADFAADLVQAVNGNGGEEYTRPDEFFRRTYLTDGMRGLLTEALRRVSGYGGVPVIQIKTAFGGGKTHSMLALYHLMHGGFNAQSIPDVRAMLERVGLSALPRVNVAVINGTRENVNEPMIVNDIPVNTLWGKIAAQLNGYAFMKRADENRTPPGADALLRMFDECGPCMVLIDELAAYGSKLYKKKGLNAGTFDNFKVFLQELTEAAKFSRNSLVVAAMPDSKLEAGDEDGMRVLDILEHVFTRVDSVWKPVAANEGFEIVRRRLFCECGDDAAREQTAEEFSRMYRDNPSDFPVETHEAEYKQRIIDCYPIHPEIFDRLYGEWSTLEQFQRTRGVLQLMAEVVCDLWQTNDTNALIMPGSINIASDRIHEKVMRYIPKEWNAIIDGDVDGANSIPYKNDTKIDRYKELQPCRRLARTIMLGSAPSAGGDMRGLEKTRILLGVVQPSENISVFTDALGTLRDALSYLYTSDSGNRFWYDTRPTLKKTVENRAAQKTKNEVDVEIRARLDKIKPEYPFVNVHACPEADELLDTEELKLLILGAGAGESEAAEILNRKLSGDRVNRNVLVFLCADRVKAEDLAGKVRIYLAWQMIDRDKTSMNLTNAQVNEVRVGLEKTGKAIDDLILEAWDEILLPEQGKSRRVDDVTWRHIKITSKENSIPARVYETLKREHKLIDKWAAEHMSMELEDIVWKDQEYITVSKLWEYVCRFCYMPKLKGRDVLYRGISEGVESGYFGLSDGKSEGKYTNLRMNVSVSAKESDVLVRKDIAESQIAGEDSEKPEEDNDNVDERDPDNTGDTGGTIIVTPPKPEVIRGCHVYVNTDAARFKRDAQHLYEDVISELQQVPGAKIEISIDLHMNAGNIDPATVKVIQDNCKARRFTLNLIH